jgi:galactokinase/dTDP-glucose pyrophosphorylase
MGLKLQGYHNTEMSCQYPVKKIFSPYRICPIGAHIDHQGGAVLGRTIDLGTTLEYDLLETSEIRLMSNQFGESNFIIGALDRLHWSRYAQAAARVLKVRRGMSAHLNGSFIGSGLSSSASVGLAYLMALADVNGIELSAAQLVQLEYQLEHNELDLQIGLLDPLTIVYGKRDTLLFMDTVAASASPIPDPPSGSFAWIVAFSGLSRELTKSGYNVRVAECHEAAARLKLGAKILSDVPREVFEERKMSLPENLRRRAMHFFTEVERVGQGAQAWRESNLELFGHLMNQSCQSSIRNYESGSDVLRELHELISQTDGIYGSRFSGGGYGGCVVALAQRDLAEAACFEITERFRQLHPELLAQVFVANTCDGLDSSAVAGGASLVTRSPASAILLAGGRGKRQRPYTDIMPKPLLEVNGRPTLDYVLSAVARAGIERVCIVTHHLEERIFGYVGDGSKWNLSATFAHQNELRGSGDALRAVPKDWVPDEPVMVLATDYILEEDCLLELVQAHERTRADITMSLKECPVEELVLRSSVEVDSNWRVNRIVEKPKLEEIMSPYAASVMFILPPPIWEYLAKVQPSPRGEIELQSAVEMMIQDGYKAFGLLQPAPREWSAGLMEKVERS